jgi:gamma-glutamylputrescine oxidase
MRETSSRGGQLFENTAVQNVKPMSGDRARVETSISSVMARHVVICGGPCLDEIYPAARRVTLPITVGALATEQLSDAVLDQMLPSRLAGSDWRLNADFWSVTADNRLLFGGGARHLRSRSRDPRPALAKRMARVFPALEGAKIDYWWDGQVDVTRSFLPQIGRLDGNVWIARGFNGVGLALGYLAGKMIADAIAGKDNAIDLFAQIPHQLFPGGRMELPTRIWMAMSTWARDLL